MKVKKLLLISAAFILAMGVGFVFYPGNALAMDDTTTPAPGNDNDVAVPACTSGGPITVKGRRCVCGGSGGSFDPNTCGLPGFPCCDRNLVFPVGGGMVVSPPTFALCPQGFEAESGTCDWYHGWNRISGTTRFPLTHGSGPQGATGGLKVVTSNGQEGWACAGQVFDNGGGSCQHQFLDTTVRCVPRADPDFCKDLLVCEIKPREDNQPFATCRGNPSSVFGPQPNNQNDSTFPHEWMRIAEGGASGGQPDAKATWCCNKPNTNFNCSAVSVPSHNRQTGALNAMPSCPAGKSSWFSYATGNPPDLNHDALVNVCCSIVPQTGAVRTLHAPPGLGAALTTSSLHQFPVCASNEVELARQCSGNCGFDDNKQTHCYKY